MVASKVPWKGAPERVTAPSVVRYLHVGAFSKSRVVWIAALSGG